MESSGGSDVMLEHDYELSDDSQFDRIESIISSNVTRDLEGMKNYLEASLSVRREKTAIVTGGSTGIGYAIAEQFVLQGYNVVVGARGKDRLMVAKHGLERLNPNVQVVSEVLDVRDPHSIKSFFDAAETSFSKVDILVNNAGIGGGGRTLSLDESHWIDIIETNLNGTYRCTKEFLTLADASALRNGRIINIASTGGKQGVLYAAAYCSSKHAIVGFTKSLGLEYAKSGITVNAVCPGFVETELAVGARQRYAKINEVTVEEMKNRIESRIPLGRYVTPSEVASAVLFFAREDSSSITAQTLNVCGGLGNY